MEYFNSYVKYWNFLAAQQRPTFLQLAQQLTQGVERFDKGSKPSDFFLSDPITSSISIYDPQNPWNNTTKSGTILHLMQPNNTLFAQVDIAAQGTVIRKNTDDVTITDEKSLIKCSGYGDPDRNSDPMVCFQLLPVKFLTHGLVEQIGSMVNEAARAGASISLKDPVGLYMDSFAKDEFQLPYDSIKEEYSLVGLDKKAPPGGTFDFQRGNIDQHMGLRLKIQIPDDVMIATDKDGGKRHANVSDLLDGSGRNVIYGSRFAENINMHLYGVVIEGGQAATPINCPCEKSKHGRFKALQVTDSGVASKESRVKSGVIGRSSFR